MTVSTGILKISIQENQVGQIDLKVLVHGSLKN